MDKKTTGAWVIHHGRKVAADVRGAAEFSAIDVAAKTGSLLARLGESDETVITAKQVEAAAKIGNLNPKTELPACLHLLEQRKLIDVSSTGDVSVLGITSGTAVAHTADLFEDNDPQPLERAAIALAEQASLAPVPRENAVEYISDTFLLKNSQAEEFVGQAREIGFVDAEGPTGDELLFNGNLFRRDSARKTAKVLNSLSSLEQTRVADFDAQLKSQGAMLASQAQSILGATLFEKIRAAAIYDMNVVSNEAGDHVLITAPGAFHKFSDPLTEDAFDHAKALVSALKYGMTMSSTARGQIWGVDLLLRKLIAGYSVGPAPAIGHDYRALEFERVVKIERSGHAFSMRLLKKEIGVIALAVLQGKDASAKALETLPSAGMRAYVPPEVARTRLRKKQSQPSKTQTHSLLSAVRGGFA